MYFVPGLNAVAYAKDCATSISQAIDAYNAGERRVSALAMHATGATDALVRQTEAVNQLNEDVDVVFSNAPIEERLPHTIHLGMWATGKAAEIVMVGQLTKAGINALAQSSSTTSRIGWTGELGENALREMGGQSQVYFRTSQGGRYVDQLIGGVAHESKVGYTSLAQSIQRQIAKDAELMATEQVESAVWHFFTSPVTGRGGPSGPLMQALTDAGISMQIH